MGGGARVVNVAETVTIQLMVVNVLERTFGELQLQWNFIGRTGPLDVPSILQLTNGTVGRPRMLLLKKNCGQNNGHQ